MKCNNGNGETKIEILKCHMDQVIGIKNKTVNELEQKIAETEGEINRLRNKYRLLKRYLGRLTRRREMAEIKCFKEILTIHKQILQLNRKLGIKTE